MVVVFTIPDLLMRQVSMLMASSRVITLIVTLLMVIVLGFMMRLHRPTKRDDSGFSVSLARLDLIRIESFLLLCSPSSVSRLFCSQGSGSVGPCQSGQHLTEAAIAL